MKDVAVLTGSGSIGQVIIRRIGALTEEQNFQLATSPTEKLLELDFIKNISDTLKAYQYSKR